MRILAAETSRPPGSIALLHDAAPAYEVVLPTTGRTTQQLFPLLQQLLIEANWTPADVELLAVTIGPGSFTGLRIGITLAKLWAYACQCPVVALDSLDVVAAQAESDAERLEVVMHAEREQLFHARFVREAPTGNPASGSSNPDGPKSLHPSASHPLPSWRRVTPTRIVERSTWLTELKACTAVIGDGLAKITTALPPGVIREPAHQWTLRAGTLGQLALAAFQRGEQVDPWTLLPNYCRLSAAEEKRLASSHA
jgi:tRNA threonylcarbamoyladenosine biosynthesis protein TsaB